jgi:hypothetical protein
MNLEIFAMVTNMGCWFTQGWYLLLNNIYVPKDYLHVVYFYN